MQLSPTWLKRIEKATSALALCFYLDAYNGLVLLFAGRTHFGASFNPLRSDLRWLPGDPLRWVGGALLLLALVSLIFRWRWPFWLSLFVWFQTALWILLGALFWSAVKAPTASLLLPGFVTIAGVIMHSRAALFRSASIPRDANPDGPE